MQKLIFDIEADGLLKAEGKKPQATVIWMLVLRDIDSDKVEVFSDHSDKYSPVEVGLAIMSKAKVIAGHNVIGYDLPMLKKFHNWTPNDSVTVWDTWIMSNTLQFKRTHKHSLAGWGEVLGAPKGDFKEFDKFSETMVEYCVQDTNVNKQVYQRMVDNARQLTAKNSLFKKGLEVEVKFAKLEAEIRAKGWLFDKGAAEELRLRIEDRMHEIEKIIVPKIGIQKVYKDSEPKPMRYTRAGLVHGTTQSMLDSDFEIEYIGGTNTTQPTHFRRYKMEDASLGSLEVVKQYLYSIGWVPDEWNIEKLPTGQVIQKSPKLTETSLEKIEDGPLFVEYNAIKNRLGILSGWIEDVERSGDGRLHGRMWTIGTPTFRCRHEVIANLPKVDSLLGKEMRSLFLPDKGMTLVGADSSGNQMRGFCHYLNNDGYTNEVINGDIHQKNADILGCSRGQAKGFLYAFLFGASAGKLYSMIHGKRDAVKGKLLMEKFLANTPGLQAVKDRLETEWDASKVRFGEDFANISGVDGRLIFVSSKHQLLNYLLQTLEGITCKAAAVYLKERLNAEGIEHDFLLHYHDEMAVQVHPRDAERVSQLAVEAFTEAPKWFGVKCMTGAAQCGNVYAEIH